MIRCLLPLLLCVLPILGLNLWAYAQRLSHLRRVACDAPEPLALLNAAWAFVGECAATAAVVLLIPMGWLLPHSRSGSGTHGPIVLVHGWGLNRSCLLWLRRRLVRDGWSPVCCFDYQAWAADVDGAAQHLRRLIEQLGASVPRQSLTLIGHGLGGLVLRYYARRYPAPMVRRIVTLGTPHFGTALASRWWGTAARTLSPGSEFLRTLNAADRVPRQFDVIAISSTFDALVLPPDNARYPEAFNIQLDRVGHYALLFSPKVYRLIVENLATPPAYG